MRNLLQAAVLSLAISGLCPLPTWAQPAPAPAPAEKQDKAQSAVPVKVVVLFSSGVGYFEHIGPVKGDTSTVLQFKTQQINDILKSLVLQDTGGGKVSTVVYPSQDPIGKTLASFQIDISKNPSMADLLNQLRGAKVKITAGVENLEGTILGLEKKPKAVEKGQIEVWQLNMISGGTIRSVPLDDVTKIELEDPRLQEELNRALTALAQARDQDKKPVTIHLQGDGERLVRVGYVVETPVWKTSYRLLIGAKDKSALQGWAIVENQTDNDWTDVQMSLVSGRPISFIQELYSPLYIPRPVVQPELYASLRPQTYDAGMNLGREKGLAEAANAAAPMAAAAADGTYARRALAKSAAPGMAGGGGFGGGGGRGGFAEEAKELSDKPMDAAASVASVASASKIGELFQYTVGNVSLPRQQSAMIPIITDPIEVEKLSIYNMNVLAKNPLNGARVKNTTKKHLLAGPITVLDGNTYAGDARIDNVPPNQERLLSYGIDLQMLVNATKNRSDTSIVGGKIVKGVLHLRRKNVFTQEYIAENKAENDKTLIIEHPIRHGWKLTEPAKAMETTDALYRFKEAIPAGEQKSLTVKEEIVTGETLAILPMDWGTMDWYSKNGEIGKDVKDAFAKAAQLKQAMEESQRQVQQRKAELNQITQDQTRIRENIKAAPDKSALKNRLLEKLEEQEKQIDAIYGKMDEQQKAYEKNRKALEDYVNNLSVGE
jgi:hypothetical protein